MYQASLARAFHQAGADREVEPGHLPAPAPVHDVRREDDEEAEADSGGGEAGTAEESDAGRVGRIR